MPQSATTAAGGVTVTVGDISLGKQRKQIIIFPGTQIWAVGAISLPALSIGLSVDCGQTAKAETALPLFMRERLMIE